MGEGGLAGGGGSSRGRGVWQGGGQGTFQSSCHKLHHHMVLGLKGLRTITLLHWIATVRCKQGICQLGRSVLITGCC